VEDRLSVLSEIMLDNVLVGQERGMGGVNLLVTKNFVMVHVANAPLTQPSVGLSIRGAIGAASAVERRVALAATDVVSFILEYILKFQLFSLEYGKK